ncbi:hypothetical protein [Parasediminibacterium sp. JCM 36343]|uniref:hypothetical protein n=1 Tax=Parasediminibacterium sp. JCM 36343 TaxID=3374279 RepID=UPI003978BB22
MADTKINLFIVHSDYLAVTRLKMYLFAKFGKYISITSFYKGESCLLHIDASTAFIVLGTIPDEQNKVNIYNAVKAANAETEIVAFADNETIGAILAAYLDGTTGVLLTENKNFNKLRPFIKRLAPGRLQNITNDMGVAGYITLCLGFIILVSAIAFFMMKLNT